MENADQSTLREWLTSGLRIQGVRENKGDAGYLLGNMIAKYTLSSDRYHVSHEAMIELEGQEVDFEKVHRRSTFYGKLSPFIYEHAIPATVIRTALLESDFSETAIARILTQAGNVAVLLRTEDLLLNEAGLGSRMPSGWSLGKNPWARYEEVGIKIAKKVLKMTGAIKR